jgi:hypothetical protein
MCVTVAFIDLYIYDKLNKFYCYSHIRSAVKIYSQPNPLFAGGTSNPLSVLGPVLFPPGNSNAPVEQLKQFYHVPTQSNEKSAEQLGAIWVDGRGHVDLAGTNIIYFECRAIPIHEARNISCVACRT